MTERRTWARIGLATLALVFSACSEDAPATNDGGPSPVTDGGGTDVATTSDATAPGDSGSPKPCPGAKPDATNTGVPPGTKLTKVTKDVVVTTDGTTIDAQDIEGFLTIKASHVKVTRTIVRGKATAATTAIVRIDSGTDITLEDVEVVAAVPSVDVDGVWGSNFVARRLHVHGGVDGMKLGDGSRVECSYVHDLAYFASDPNQGGGPTHNDAIQILSGKSIAIVGNNLLATKNDNAAIQITQDFGAVSDVHVERNWADGGGCTFNFSHKGQASLGDLHTSNNRFGRSSFFDCPILKSTKTTLDSQLDVWDDDGKPVPIQTHD
jgi:hypothetical protein